MKQLILSADVKTNFIMHMLHLAQYPDSDYSRRYAGVHQPENLQLLRENIDLMTLRGAHDDPAVREVIDRLLVGPLLEDEDMDPAAAMQLAAAHILTADMDVTSVFFELREEYHELLDRAFRVAEAMERECRAYEERVWLYEQVSVQALADLVMERLQHDGIIYRAMAMIGLDMGETQAVTVLLSDIPYGAYTSLRLDDASFVELRSDPDELYSAVVMDLIAGLMGSILVAEGEKEPEPMEGYIAIGMMMYYHEQLTGDRRYIKHYDDVIVRCEALEEHRRLGAPTLYVRLKAAFGLGGA